MLKYLAHSCGGVFTHEMSIWLLEKNSTPPACRTAALPASEKCVTVDCFLEGMKRAATGVNGSLIVFNCFI